MLGSRHVPLAAPAGFAPARLRSERSRLLLPHGATTGTLARTSTGITGLGRPRSVCLSYKGKLACRAEAGRRKLVRPVGVAPTPDPESFRDRSALSYGRARLVPGLGVEPSDFGL